MDTREFDALVARISNMASRREAVLGIAGGALASVGVAAAVDARKKQRAKGRADVRSQGQGGKKKRKVCLCASYEMLECEDRTVQKKKVRKLLRDNPGSFQGTCDKLSNRVPGRDR